MALSPFRSYLDDFSNDFYRLMPYWLKRGDSVDQGTTISKITNNHNKFGIKIDVSHFKPEELQVSLDGHVLIVEGDHEIHDDEQYLKRTFVRKWTIPNDCDLASVHCVLTKDGQLIIETKKSECSPSKNIPIDRA